MRWIAMFLFCLLVSGCAQIPQSESDVFDEMIQLTSGYDAASEAAFTYDMNWIIFQAIPRGEKNYQMYLARLLKDGDRITGIGQAIRVSPPDSQNSSGAFSANGISMIFASTAGRKSGGQSQLPSGMDLYRADAWQGAIAATEFSRGINLARNKLTDNESYDDECSFSPDGKWILFTSTRNADPTRPTVTLRDADIYLMKSDGTNVIRLTTSDGYDGSAFFSPNGRQILFRSARSDGRTIQYYLADLESDFSGSVTGIKNIVQLSDNGATHFRPAWHPDGLHVFYSSNQQNPKDFDLYMMRTDGRHQLRMTFNSAFDLLPVVSSDGKYLMWTSRRSSDHTAQIYIAKLKMPAAG